MCRRNEAVGTALMAFGAGLLISVLFSSGIWTVLVGIGAIALGCLLARRR